MSSSLDTRRPWLVPLLAFALAIGASRLFGGLPPPFATLAWKLSWMVVVFGALLLARRIGLVGALDELGLRRAARGALAWALLASLPMLCILAIASRGRVDITAERLVMGVLVGPLTEEILFRGYLFRQLYRRAQWKFSTSVLVTSLIFGLMHLPSALAHGEVTDILLQVGITALGGAFFAWLFVRWGDDLWVPILVHTLLNLWWELFGSGATAVGDTGANVARASAIALTIAITLWQTKRTRPETSDRSPRSGA